MNAASDFSFCPVLAELIRTQRTVGETGKVFGQLGALSTVNNLRVLRGLMLERRPTRTLEVGLSFGGSALTIAASHRELGHSAQQQHLTIDPYQHSVWDNSGLNALERAGLIGFVDHRSQFSSIALAELLGENRMFDLIYIDGSHRFDDVFVDAYFAFRLLSDDGLVLFDDCSTDEVATVLSFVTTNWDSWVHEVDLSPYRAAGDRWRYRIGRWMSKVQLRSFRKTGGTLAWDAPLHRF